MAAYKDIIGQKITKVTSNPGEPKTGQMWYNSTTGTLKGLGVVEAWSSASPLTRASAGGYYGSIGTSTSSLALVGTPGNSSPLETEEWNGTGWSASDNMAPYPGISGNMTPQGGASGTVTSALYTGGEQYTGNTENKAQEYNGSSWTQITNTPVKTGYNVGIGTASDTSMSVGGYNESYAFLTNTLNWNGSSWTAGGSLSTARWGASGGGTNTAAWFSGGKTGSYPGTNSTGTENYNGTAWSSGDSLNTARWLSGGTGPQTAAMVIGERPSPGTGRNGNTEVYNGTAWAETADLATARVQFKGTGGTSGGAFVGGGNTPPNVANTEEFTKSTNTITAAAWSSGGNMGTARYGGMPFGVGHTSQVSCGGLTAPPPGTHTNNSETYDGTSWTEGNNINTERYNGASGGTETAGVITMGRAPPGTGQTTRSETEEYDGTSWTSVTASPESLYKKCGAGTQTSLIITGGLSATAVYPTTSLEYDGTNWTSGGTAPFGGNYMDGVGNETAAVVFGSNSPSDPNPQVNNKSFDYDGSTWTTNNNMNINHGGQHSAGGTTTSALVAGGGSPYAAGQIGELYDGTSFATNPSLATGGQRGGKATTVGNAFAVGGYGGPPGTQFLTSTEEFTEETETANIADFTTS